MMLRLSSSVYSFDGILVFGLLFICTCAYLKKVPRLNSWLLSEKKGVWGVFYKGKQRVKYPNSGITQQHIAVTKLKPHQSQLYRHWSEHFLCRKLLIQSLIMCIFISFKSFFKQMAQTESFLCEICASIPEQKLNTL